MHDDIENQWISIIHPEYNKMQALGESKGNEN